VRHEAHPEPEIDRNVASWMTKRIVPHPTGNESALLSDREWSARQKAALTCPAFPPRERTKKPPMSPSVFQIFP